ncbi:hypothetical protein B0H14DRAFT_2656792 [Mycena olivaceomarginata]|nr:hypothetical protein B0H14DRAFT_2656792 [Mycena olivaceomarginata]
MSLAPACPTPLKLTQVDLVLPPTEAFYKPATQVLLGRVGPKSVDRYITVQDIWTSWIDSEAVYNTAGIQTGKKPPIKLVEQYLQRTRRYRATLGKVPGDTFRTRLRVGKLEAMRVVGDQTKGVNWLRQEVSTLRKQAAKAAQAVDGPSTSSMASTSTTPTLPLPATFEEDVTKRKRAPAADPRRPKKAKKLK